MRKNLIVVLLSCVLMGCVLGSVEPFYTPDLVVEMPQLYGSWAYEKNTESGLQTVIFISKGTIAISDKGMPPAEAKLTFFRVDGHLFADIYPVDGPLRYDLVGDLDPVHLVCLVSYEEGRLLFNPLNYEWVLKQAEAGQLGIPFEKSSMDKDADAVFTASSEQWVEFLKKHRSDPQAFPHMDQGWLIRRSEDKVGSR